MVENSKLYIIPEKEIDSATQKVQLQKDLFYLEGFLLSVDKKLNNERFVQNAKPEIVETEKKERKRLTPKQK